MMRSNRFVSVSLSFFLLIVLGMPVFAQEIELRHHFQTGQTAKTQTDVQMQGDSFITGNKSATQLQMQMIRDMRVNSVDSLGNAKMNVAVQRIRTQGKMENSSFNKDLTGADLKNVMYGADQMNVEVSPTGYVQGEDDQALQKLGISIPSSLGNSGGFEFPTFPAGAVRVGDAWTENGQLLRGVNLKQGDLAGQCVYKLTRISPSAQGRIGVIRYKKTTDLSGLGLGGNSLDGQGAGIGTASTQVGGLVIQLEGEIEFNIDKGCVVKTTQQGTWNMDMSMNAGAMDLAELGRINTQNTTSARRLTPTNNQQKTGMKQNMKIKIATQFQWTGQQKVQEPQKVQAPQALQKPLEIKPPVVAPPTLPELPKVSPEKKELP